MNLQKRNSLTKSLEKIQIAWNGIKGERYRCLDNFKKWCTCRRRTLSALEKFQDEFDKIHQCSSTVQAVGNGATLLGSLATFVGFGLSFSKNWNPIGKELMKYGSTVGTIGGATTMTASILDYGFSSSVLKEVKAALEEDRQQTEELLGWFERTKELEAQLQEVFGCGVANINDVLTVIREVYVIYSKGGRALNNLRCYLSLIANNFSLNHLPKLDDKKLETLICNAGYKVQLLLKEFCNSPEVRAATWRIYDSFKKSPVSFELSKVSIRIIGKASVQEIGFFSHLASADGQSFMRCVGSTARGIFRIINVALSVVAFLSAVDDIKKGKSKYSEMVEKTRIYLLMELKELESCPMLKNYT